MNEKEYIIAVDSKDAERVRELIDIHHHTLSIVRGTPIDNVFIVSGSPYNTIEKIEEVMRSILTNPILKTCVFIEECSDDYKTFCIST